MLNCQVKGTDFAALMARESDAGEVRILSRGVGGRMDATRRGSTIRSQWQHQSGG